MGLRNQPLNHSILKSRIVLHSRLLLIFFAVLLVSANVNAQEKKPEVERFHGAGTITKIAEGQINIKASDGKTIVLRFPHGRSQVVVLNAKYRYRAEAEVSVQGKLDASEVGVGDTVQFVAILNRVGRAQSPITKLTVIDSNTKSSVIEAANVDAPDKSIAYLVTGRIKSIRHGKLTVTTAKVKGVSRGLLRVQVNDQVEYALNSSRIEQASIGDTVDASGNQYDGQDILVRSASITHVPTLLEQKPKAERRSKKDQGNDKYRKYSNEPKDPRPIRSQHFVLNTDVSDRDAHILLDKLETMYGLLVQYFGKAPQDLVQVFYVRDITLWPADVFPEKARMKILEPAGVAIYRYKRLGRQYVLRGAAYSCNDPGVAQHEAVHAICILTYGTSGPTWYGEGLAELGQYWKKGQLAVDINPNIIKYLKSEEPKSLVSIVDPKDTPGTWKEYAWRWALCHLLEHNKNYRSRFKPLGIALMKKEETSFEKVYGDVAREVSFEYDFFLRHFGNGYRVDLCTWDWQTRFNWLSKNKRKTMKVRAKNGWQASGLQVRQGDKIEFSTTGTWQLTKGGEKLTAAGNSTGEGSLRGILMSDYKLSKPFKIKSDRVWTAPQAGLLYLRCKDEWNKLADNSGTITVKAVMKEAGAKK